MGKYLKKLKAESNAKAPWELTVMEVTTTSTQSCLGVRTRAKTLALQSLQKTAAGGGGAAVGSTAGGVSYLQLRNRRLEKPPVHDSKRKNRSMGNPNPRSSPNLQVNSKLRVSGGGGDGDKIVEGNGDVEKIVADVKEEKEVINNGDFAVEVSFGENVLDFEGRGRSTRESTPCSLIKDSDTIKTPGSTTRPASALEMNQRIENSARRNIPTAHEMNDFFYAAEQQEQNQFKEKYNFDPVNEKPLSGRYEWVKLDP